MLTCAGTSRNPCLPVACLPPLGSWVFTLYRHVFIGSLFSYGFVSALARVSYAAFDRDVYSTLPRRFLRWTVHEVRKLA